MRQFTVASIMCISVIVALYGCTKGTLGSNGAAVPAATKSALHVIYFHRTIRCPSCNKIEALTEKAVEDAFGGDLASGKIQWRVLNLDEAPNKHFEEYYNLKAQSVVLSEVRDGKETRWKNLEKVWDLLDDDDKFLQYIQDEIRAFVPGT